MHRYRFAARPRWLLSHVLVLALVIVMVNLGFWQLRRLDEKRDFNATVRAHEQAGVAPVSDVLEPRGSVSDAERVSYRRVTATGIYDASGEVLVRSRSLAEQPGVWVLTPLVTGDGVAVVVNRGFVPTQGVPERAPEAAGAPAGTVTVTGLLMPSQRRGRFGPTDPSEGKLSNLARADIERLQQQVPYDLYTAYVQLSDQDPPSRSGLPEVLPRPDLSEGPHLSYAVQWFTFSLIAAVGYPLVLRRQARDA